MATAGLKIVLPSNFTDATLPVLYDDSIMSTGTLALYDLAHSANPASGYMNLTSGVPAAAALVNNIGWKQCNTVIGSGTQTTLAAAVATPGAFVAGAGSPRGVFERSVKGGLHCVVSQASALASGDGAKFSLPTALTAYVAANPSHTYFASLWDNTTRANTMGAGGADKYGVGGAGSTSNFELLFNDRTGPIGTHVASSRSSSLNTVGAAINNQSTNAGTGTVYGGAGGDNNAAIWGCPTGTYNAGAIATANTHWPSWVFYRFYLEDLTVSGRTYATVDALDFAAYTRDVTTSGGRYNGDTYTAPGTLLA